MLITARRQQQAIRDLVAGFTPDLNRDAHVDEKDLGLIERRVGLRCDGSPVEP